MYNYLIDSHCHLNTLEDEKGLLVSDIVEKANQNQVKIINNISTEVEEFVKVLNVAEKYENVYATIGIHPSNIKNVDMSLNELLSYASNKKVIAFGETGLEYNCEPITDKTKQKKNFEIHIEACRQANLPLVIHSRDADNDMIDMLKSEMKNGEFRFVLHCFSSSKDLCWTGLDLGGFISLSGIITFKNANELRNIIKDVPLDRIFLETDSPYLAPTPFRGQINEPAYVKNIAEYLVDFLKKDYINIQEITTKNFLKLFNKVKPLEN
ncbi:MAG TPA: TatD family hydrolase [Rickettsiales bacterium]|nr:TatD family hydrolase [Rickettsiales bacterium]